MKSRSAIPVWLSDREGAGSCTCRGDELAGREAPIVFKITIAITSQLAQEWKAVFINFVIIVSLAEKCQVGQGVSLACVSAPAVFSRFTTTPSLGATVNMDGAAPYQGVAALFIAQVFHLDLSFIAQLSIVLTITFASIGAAGVPGAGRITLMLVLTTVGIPQQYTKKIGIETGE